MAELHILSVDTCSTCPFKKREPNGTLTCRFNPPSTSPVYVVNAHGQVAHMGNITVYTTVQDIDWCWQHPNLVKPTARPMMMQ
jgi:hypothetical protein